MAENLTMKMLGERFAYVNERLAALEDAEEELPEWATDIMVAAIKALYAMRSQGSHNHANALVEKYFPGEDLEVGDAVTLVGSLYSAGKEAT